MSAGSPSKQKLQVQGLHVMASSWPATAYMLHKKDAPALLSEPTVLETASRIGKHASQVLIRWYNPFDLLKDTSQNAALQNRSWIGGRG